MKLKKWVVVVIAVVFIISALVCAADYRGNNYFGEFFGIQFTALLISVGCVVTLMRYGR